MIVIRNIELNSEDKIKLFSELYKQKEYNIVSDIKYSGLKRTYKKILGRQRVKIAEKIDRSILKDKQDLHETNLKLIKLKPTIQNRSLLENEINVARTNHPKIHIISEGSTPFSLRRVGNNREDIELFNNKRYLVNIPKTGTTGELYHEIGHTKNASGKNGIKAIINNRIADKDRALQEGNDIINKLNYKIPVKNQGILRTIRNKITGDALLSEEVNASKTGINELTKRNILPENILNSEIQYQTLANKTYKLPINIAIKTPIRNSIQIPSLRGKFNPKIYKNKKWLKK